MRALRRFFRQAISWFSRERDEERLRAEMEEHLAMQTAENVKAGLLPDEARRRAVLKFGALEATKESYREQRGLPFLETLFRDTRQSLRGLRKTPAFAVATVLTLALGIGATTSIFTLVHAVLLKSLAVSNPTQLLRVGKEARCCYDGGYSQEKEFSLVSYDLYKYFRDHTRGFAELAAFSASEGLFGVRRAGRSEAAQSFAGEYVSGNYFAMFGVPAYAGRVLTARDDTPGAPAAVVMSYRLWQLAYGSDPSVVGGVFDFNNKPFTVVGIAPPDFFGETLRESAPDFFLPLALEAIDDGDLNKPDVHWLHMIGRMQSGASPATIEAEMRVHLQHWLRSHWGEMSANDRARLPEQTLYLRPGGAGITSMREQYEHWLHILMTVSGCVLLIVCANIANLMLVRGLENRRQISLSMALGASTSRLTRQALTESILLSFMGGAAGLAVAFAGTRLILHFAFPPERGFGNVPISASPSAPVILFAFVVSLATGIAFGLAPAWMATRVDPIEALRGAGRATARTGSLPRKALVVLQAALSLALLSASGLLTGALHKLESQDFGFMQEGRTVINFGPSLAGYKGRSLTPLYRRICDAITNIPGVSKVALATYSPLNGNSWGSGVWVDGHPRPGPKDDDSAAFDRVTADYFETIGNPIIRGRGIAESDTDSARHVAVINEALVRKFFKGEDPIGKHFGRSEIGTSRLYEVIGVAKDARYNTFDLDLPVSPYFFLPTAQYDTFPGSTGEANDSSHVLRDIVVAARPGARVTSAQLRHAVASVDSNLPIISVHTLGEQVGGVFSQQRLIARLTSFFGVLSLFLACIGLYGVTSYNAGRRVTEIGIRMALGADRGQVTGLVLRGAFTLIALGLLAGLPLAFAAGRFLGTQLYGTRPYNPVVLSAALLALGMSAFIASLIPALRASRISPLRALRAE